MEQEITLNEHNKQEYPPMHISEFNTPLIRLLVLMLGLLFFGGCASKGEADTSEGADTVITVPEDSLMNDTSDTLLGSDEPILFSKYSNFAKRHRELTDEEIANLNFDNYSVEENNYKLMDNDGFIRWKEFVKEYKPYYSIETCPRCGTHLLVIYSETPDDFILSGRGGYFLICTHCKKECWYEEVWMS